MSEQCCAIRIGQAAPDFKLDTCDPSQGDFSEIGKICEALK